MFPPMVRDDRYPRGFRIQSDAPASLWTSEAVFESREHCDQARRDRIDEEIDKAKLVYDADAKNELPVRRAVNARCER